MGASGTSGTETRYWRAARLVHPADRFRLAPSDRRRDGCRRSPVGWKNSRQAHASSCWPRSTARPTSLTFETKAAATVHWVHRGAAPGGTAPLVEALNAVSFPEGDYYAWIACESSSAKHLRQALIAEHGANPKWIRASGYWRRGAAGAHDSFDE